MEVHFSDRIERAFVVDGEQLKRLVHLLSERVGKGIRIELQCSDKSTRMSDNVVEALEYENAKDKRIESIRITARSEVLRS